MQIRFGIGFFVILLSSPVYAYKFLCNGITAEGFIESDNCGVCDDITGSRWPNNSVQFNVNTSVRPRGLSVSGWKDLVKDCFDVWSKTPDAQLAVTYGGEGARSFGTDSTNHDIFFISDELEWMDAVGAGPEGILGVTLPPYSCQNETISYRVIDDADMILNAVESANFPWELSCSSLLEDCQSIRATVAHESGHFLGLGHPCTDCESLMAAQATYLVEYPLFDDQAGFRALYPGSASGSFGSSCLDTSDCATNLICHTQNSEQYCSHSCIQNSECTNHMMCTNGFCEFPFGVTLGAAGVNEDCTQKPCAENLICFRLKDDSSAYCFEDCTASQTCQVSKTCHQLSNSQDEKTGSYACILMVDENDACGVIENVPNVCAKDFTCLSGACARDTFIDYSYLENNSSSVSCSNAKASHEIWLLFALLGILVHRLKKKC